MKNPYQLSDDEDPQLLNGLTPGTSQQTAPVAPQPLPPMAPTAPAPAAIPKPAAVQLPGMPPSMTPDELTPYLGAQKASLNKFGPSQQMELENSLVNQRNGLGYRVADAGKGFADALMQGVAGAGNPGWQKQFEDQNMMQGQERLGAMQKAHEGQLQDTEAGMKLDTMNPTSAVSKSFQDAASPIFEKMGISPDRVRAMPASQIETIATLGLKSEDIQMQAELKKLMLELQTMTGMASVEDKKSQRKQEAAKGLSALGVIGGVVHPEAKAAFESELGDKKPAFSPDVVDFAKTHGITPDQAQAIKTKRGGK